MGGVTVAHQGTTTSNTEYDIMSMNQDHLSQLLANQTDYVPVEDLTGEVEELMMRESVGSWLQPWSEENNACLINLDTYAESMQLEELFGQTQSVIYDAFVQDDLQSSPASSDTSAQASPVVEKSSEDIQFMPETVIVDQLSVTTPIEEVEINIEEEEATSLKRKHSLVSSDESSDDNSSSEEEEEDSDSEAEEAVVIPTTVANMNSRVVYSSDDSDSENEMVTSRATSPSYMYMHKRQIEETLLDRITNQLHPEKLPGILPILASDKKASNQQEDEIEIDLSCLAREQLVQVLLYVDACILEQEGGPTVNVDDYIQKKKGPRTRPAVRRRPPMPKKTKTRAELTEDIDADSSSDEEELTDNKPKSKPASSEGPISMASLSKKRRGGRKNNRKSRKVDDDDALVSSVSVIQDPNSIASSRPKRRSALHKRRLLEEMLAPSDDNEDDDEDDTQIVVFGNEEMDFGVLRNETIVHQVDTPVITTTVTAIDADVNENTDEEIDIMF